MSAIEAKVRSHPLTREISDEREEGAGIWVYPIDGYCTGEIRCQKGCVHAVHEATWTKVFQGLNKMVKCTCGEC